MYHKSTPKHSLEILEQRIAPAALLNESGFLTTSVGTPLLLKTGQGLSTGGVNSGTYLLYVEKGSALVFTTDFNNNNAIDYNEITGIAAGDGLRLISFVDIHGDIVTNLRPDSRLSDSDNNPDNDIQSLGGDGRVLLNSTIEKIELRSLTVNDIGDQNGVGALDANGKPIVDQADVAARLALSSYSIFGNVLAGGGFGIQGDNTSGLIIDDVGKSIQAATFVGGTSTVDFYVGGFNSSIGSIKVGSAASDTPFSFSISAGDDVQGRIVPFTPTPGTVGAGIFNIRAANVASTFNLNSLESGKGGVGAKGGDIVNVQLNGDNAGGYQILAGDGGDGTSGGNGGSILNLSDFGSVTGEVILKTGNGGNASTKTGGNGGALTFGTINLNGNVQVFLGNGGDGFTAGGNGASLLTGVITTPSSGKYTTSQIVSTTIGGTAAPGGTKIGTPVQIDFNEDGFGDYLYTTNNPSQLVVMFGDGTGFISGFTQISLGGPVNAEAVVVADFNGDGHLDIAAASSQAGSFGGISVFLSRFENPAGGTPTATQDLNGDGLNSLLGFDSPLFSPLPALYEGDANAGFGGGANQAFHRSANAIGSITAGDFDGNQTVDLAVVATYYFGKDNTPIQVPIILKSDIENSKPTGQFYADFGTKTTPPATPLIFDPLATGDTLFYPGATGSVIIHASYASTTSNHALIYVGEKNGSAELGRNNVYAYDNSTASLAGPALVGTYKLGKVDTNRLSPQGNNRNVSLESAELGDFTLGDIDGDGSADVAIVTSNPSPDFLVLIGGTPTGAPKTAAQPYLSDVVGDAEQNAGISLKRGDGVSFGTGSPVVGIRLTAAQTDGVHNDLSLLNYQAPNPTVNTLTFAPRTTINSNGGTLASFGGGTLKGTTTSIVAFDAYAPLVNGQSSTVVADALQADIPARTFEYINLVGPAGLDFFPAVASSFSISAGDGGNALIGRGGIGGSIGSGIRTAVDPFTGIVDAVGSLDFTFALSGNQSVFQAGDGGNGFTTGGKGGSVSGIVVRTQEVSNGALLTGLDFSSISLIAGTGGFGVSGAGGEGGDISRSSIQDAVFYMAGSGGRGKTGGNGGSITGNQLPNIFDSLGSTLVMQTGSGGDGVKAAGAGGSVTNFRPTFNSGPAAFYVTTGNGGASVSGTGGPGGSIRSVVPSSDINLLASEIFFQAGDGGRGKSGGAGGSISNFVDTPTTSGNPTIVSFLAGNGGAGITGKGGNGGALSGLTLPSTGTLDPFIVQFSPVTYDRFIAGNGGNSSGGAGGVGGQVANLNVQATSGSMAITAGAGGDGLRGGGVGGSVVNTIAGVGGGVISKLLVIGGKGGDSLAFPNANPLKSFGGSIAKAGNGGSISNLTQNLGIDTRIDLIAGNGGDTTRFGTSTGPSFVGKGGSVMNVTAKGSLGIADATTPLKSYNNTADANGDGRIDQSIAQFVQTSLRAGGAPALTDAVGNVGVIVGAAGRLRTVESATSTPTVPNFISLPAGNGVNGSFLNIKARALESAVAGSITRVAAIQLVSGIRIGPGASDGLNFTPVSVGTDKAAQGVFEYLTPTGAATTAPERDGALIDGAVFTNKRVTLPGDPILSGRVFIA